MSDFSQPNPSMPPPPPPTFPVGPPGSIAYGQPLGALDPPKGLRIATIVLCWVVTAFALLLGLLAYQRGNVAHDLINGSASLKDATDADDRVGAVAAVMFAAMLATAIVICIWSSRTVSNAKRRDPLNPGSPGLAAGGWFIPVGWLFVSFQQFRQSTHRLGARIPSLTAWQVAFIIAWVLLVVQRIQGNVTVANFGDSDSRLHGQGLIIVLMAVAFAVATVAATRAMREIDTATSGNPS